MGSVTVDDLLITPLKQIPVDGGDVLHCMKRSDPGFIGFGEAYFSIIEPDAIKAWKKHSRMTLNIVVPFGKVLFVFVDDEGRIREEIVGKGKYVRLTVPPGIWFGFKGIFSSESIVMNIANIQHDPAEVERKTLDQISYSWELR